MRKIFLVLLSTIVFHALAQKKDKSSGFDIPEGRSYVLQLKNGNSFFMELTKKEGIKVILFDSLRKKISGSTLDLKLVINKAGKAPAEGVFEANGDVVIFVNNGEESAPSLLRVIVDGKTGKLRSEEKIAELDKAKAGAGDALATDLPGFYIVKDFESEYYALIRYNAFAAETKDRMEVIHYSPDHQVLNKANYSPPELSFKYTRYLDAFVDKDNYVMISAYCFNTGKTDQGKSKTYVAQLSRGKTTFKQQQLAFVDSHKATACSFYYNKNKQLFTLVMITDILVKGDSKMYEYRFQNMNPVTLKVEKDYFPDLSPVNTYYKEKMARKADLGGVLRKIEMDKNGNMLLMFQQEQELGSKSGIKANYGDVALLTVSPEGKTLNSAVFPAALYADDNAATTSGMALILGEKGTYLLFGNSVDNMLRPETEAAKILKDHEASVPVKYTYGNNTFKKEYLFKEPKEKKGNAYCDFSTWNYNPLTKKCVTLFIDPEKAKASLVWINVE